MTETEFRINHSKIIQYYQLVEDRLRVICAALLADEDYEAAYKKADRALYAAKEKGRNTHVILRADSAREAAEQQETERRDTP